MVYITKPVMVAALVIAPAIAAPVSQFADDKLYSRKEPKKSNIGPSIIRAGVLAGGLTVPAVGKFLRDDSDLDARESLDNSDTLYARKEPKKSNIGPSIIRAGILAGGLTVPAAGKFLRSYEDFDVRDSLDDELIARKEPKKPTIGPSIIRAGVLAGGLTVPAVGKVLRDLESAGYYGRGFDEEDAMEVREIMERLEMYEHDIRMALDELD
ncbi:hypothetical protein D9611_009166 [Ephemerocybe angulata]|uniref:Uncharacterized protein n=1 Tax=Ephemerocybe angulata TaxID=980116 RepID=A0A8H5CDE0_9AGAR|nr:hypothetical protein D9611_009166 [Tulosesus angulatus]